MLRVSLSSLKLFVSQRKNALGLSFVLYVAVIWVVSSFIVQDLVGAGLNPFLLTYIANSLFIVLIPLSSLAASRNTPAPEGSHNSEPQDKQLLSHNEASSAILGSPSDSSCVYNVWTQVLYDKQLKHAALVVAPLWFAAQLTFNFSLTLTNVTSNTILSSTSSLFTFGLSCILLGERFTTFKLVSIFTCIGGIAMVTFGDSRNRSGQQSFQGDMLCLLSSLFYAAYTVAIRKLLPADNHANISVLLGLIGIFNLIGMAPVLLLLWLTSVISLQGVTAWLVLLTVCKGLFDNVLSDYLWARAVLLIGPTLATVGLSIQVPLAVAADCMFSNPPWLHSISSASIAVCGAVAVLCGFMGVALSTSHTSLDTVSLDLETSDEELVRSDAVSQA